MKNNVARKMTLMLLLVLVVHGTTGCSKKPKGFPKLHPMNITVTDGTESLPNLKIMFYPKSGSTAYVISGETKDGGVAQIYTMQGEYSSKGAPEGEYVVTIAEELTVEHRLTPEERSRLTIPEKAAYAQEREKQIAALKPRVPQILCVVPKGNTQNLPERSPIVFKVENGKNELKVDVSTYQ